MDHLETKYPEYNNSEQNNLIDKDFFNMVEKILEKRNLNFTI